jgi:hypothetical protein
MAPAWLAPALQQNLSAMETRIMDKFAVTDSKLAVIDSKLAVINSKIYNGTALEDLDTLIPPQANPTEPPPPPCPTTVRAMRMLESGPDLTSIETYYGLPHNGNLKSRLNRLRRVFGISIVL